MPGVTLQVHRQPMGVDVHVAVAPGTRPEQPIHLCFGMLPPEGTLEIRTVVHVGAGPDVRFLACCTFPRATRIRHHMDSTIQVEEGAAVE